MSAVSASARVSVIVPTYNYAFCIAETLRSLQQQTYENWECIIVDDGSTDNTSGVVADFVRNDHRIHYIQTVNQGPSSARNTGIALASGDFLAFLDADDVMPSHKLFMHIEHFDKHGDTDISYGPARYFENGSPERLYKDIGLQDRDWMPCISGRAEEMLPMLVKRNILPICSAVIRKCHIDRLGGFDPELRMLEDWELWLRLACGNLCFRYLDDMNACVNIRVHGKSLSRDSFGMMRHLRIFRRRYVTRDLLSIEDEKLRNRMHKENEKLLRKDIVRAMKKQGLFSPFVRRIIQEEPLGTVIYCATKYFFGLGWLKGDRK